ncbi:MAG: ABC transporter permease subunit [Rhodococcus sp. (in: high G+C Gram-positive bacteria)]|uniref:ABC transporter permease subunit n=1 Tax=Rhodococcus sp. TaxID=1831 RepID=UPI002AD7B242|nr:ABC transporter permease subunit [Rhodococcus sp. (in: high G+C Gram-positive bacteria)]
MSTRAVEFSRPSRGIGVTTARVCQSEWTKFRSLRHLPWTLFTSAALLITIGFISTLFTARDYAAASPGDTAGFEPIGTALAGVTFAQLATGALGILLITGEYSSGTVGPSLTAVPARLPVLWAKLVVLLSVVCAVSCGAAFSAFFIGQALLSGNDLGVSLDAPDGLRAVLGSAASMSMAAVIGLGVGALLRNSAAAISVFVGLFFVLPPLVSALPSWIGSHLSLYMPSNAGAAIYGIGGDGSNSLSPGIGLAVLCGEAALAIGAAAYRLRRGDA